MMLFNKEMIETTFSGFSNADGFYIQQLKAETFFINGSYLKTVLHFDKNIYVEVHKCNDSRDWKSIVKTLQTLQRIFQNFCLVVCK